MPTRSLGPGVAGLLLLAFGCSQAEQIVELEPEKPISARRFERMSDKEYLDYMIDCFDLVVSGNRRGEELKAFVHERVRRAGFMEGAVRVIQPGKQGRDFWIAAVPPGFSDLFIQYSDEMNALLITRSPMAPVMAGITMAHEFEHARTNLLDTGESHMDIAGFIREEIDANLFEIEMADHVTGGAFSRLIRRSEEEGSLLRMESGIHRPDEALKGTLDQLLGVPYLAERPLRDGLYACAASLQRCENSREQFMVIYTLLIASGLSFDAESIAARGWITHDRYPVGMMMRIFPDEPVRSPVAGRVSAITGIRSADHAWQGILIEGSGMHTGSVIRIIGFIPTVEIGQELIAGQPIGNGIKGLYDTGQEDVRISFEMYLRNSRQESIPFLERALPRAEFVHPEEWQYPGSERYRVMFEALDLESERDYIGAIELLRSVESIPGPDDILSDLYHMLARIHAARGDFDAAVAIQQRVLELLQSEYHYGAGGIPSGDLGTIFSGRTRASLELLIHHHEANLRAYRRGRDTIYVY